MSDGRSRIVKVLVNALCVTNLSGRAVLLGHLEQLAKWTSGTQEFLVLYHKKNQDIVHNLGTNTRWMQCPSYTSHWAGRAVWERTILPGVINKSGSDVLFMLSGTNVGNVSIPQVSLALNPWCLVQDVHNGIIEKLKAYLQRRAYAKAVRNADMMAYCSDYIRDAFRKNAGCKENSSVMAYCGLNEDVLQCKIPLKPIESRKKIVLLQCL